MPIEMSQDDELPDTLTQNSTLVLSEIPASLPPIWGMLVRRKAFIHSVELRNERYVFGRKASCDIYIDSIQMPPSMLRCLSQQHFVISRDRTLMPYIQDISKNGTYLNGTIIGKDKSVALRNGDLIAVGLKFHEIFQFKDEALSNVSEDFDKKYKITRLLGKGAFGEVYLAIAKNSCSRYAAKRIAICPKDELKIENEIKILETMNHPYIISMKEAIYCRRGFVYIILEYMEGGDLQNRVLKNGKLPEINAKLFIYQITEAVKYLHSCGIAHRDLKPENVLLQSKNTNTLIKITDFGMSKFVGKASFLHSMCGTPLYVAPEILTYRYEKKVSYTSLVDVWSLGCITYFTLWGRTPFQEDDDECVGEDYLQVLYSRIKRGQFKIPSQELFEEDLVSDQAIDLILRMLVRDPKSRIEVKDIFDHDWFKDKKMLTIVRMLS